MSIFRNLPIARKFVFAFGIVCLLCALQGALAIYGFVKINSTLSDMAENAMPARQALGEIRMAITQTRRADLALLLCATDECTTTYKAKREKAAESFAAGVRTYTPLISHPGEQALSESFQQNFAEYQRLSAQGREAAAEGKVDVAMKIFMDPSATKAVDLAQQAADSANDLAFNVGVQEGNQAISRSRQSLMLIVSLVIVTVVLCALTGVMLTHLIAPSLRAATTALEQVAAKDLTVSVEAIGTDEIGRMCTALNTCVAAMRLVLGTVAQGAENLTASATEMSVRSVQANANAQAQSGKTNQIAAAAQEMTATIGEISRNAETASNISRKSAETASEGGAVMQTAALTMERISSATSSVAGKMTGLAARSEEIGKVVTVIQDISEQTNLLALNAAIEAARAGDHGRGFAVVAGEVRRLAERTRSATEEIAGTIRGIQDETRATLDLMEESHRAVDSGIGETSRARQSLAATIESAREVEHMIRLIATAATEQTSAAGEISESAAHISQLAMENSRTAEETADGCKQLSGLANDLDGVIRQFHLQEETQPGGNLRGKASEPVSRSWRTA
ncbi:HAMP domain-containing methyl-accepting chemotaxis protein [Acidicapsa acidisoli]|uniref:HAMP domain-containing methyl-accepting chemotaxis protein n=1 Tax=Acidicapsa acidisoli TaxID=1615681 RepID=UPI0021DF5992|nr:methyl-accepting chemotaxis protein [Acidicapsa acidisoli]